MDVPGSDHVIVFNNMDDPDRTTNNHSTTETQLRSSDNNPSTKLQTLRRLSLSKPKARFVEFSHPTTTQKYCIPESDQLDPSKRIIDTSDDDETEEDDSEDDEEYDEEGYVKERPHRKKKKFKINCRILIEWIFFIIISSALICSLTIPNRVKYGLDLWRWILIILVVFSGRLLSGWIIKIIVFLIERNFMLREKVLYFVYGLRKSIQNCVWLGLVLLSWTIIFNATLHRNSRLLAKVFQALVAVLIAATIWLVKIILVKVLASSFHVATYFDRMKESVFQHYVLETLSGPPMDDVSYEEAHRRNLGVSRSLPAKLRETRVLSKRLGSRKIDIEKLRKLSMQSTASAWTVKRLVNYVRSFGLTTISKTVDQFNGSESEITSEWEARNCAKRIFKNVAKPGAK